VKGKQSDTYGWVVEHIYNVEFLAAKPEVLGSIPGATRFSE
jgi:hypothetical protein